MATENHQTRPLGRPHTSASSRRAGIIFYRPTAMDYLRVALVALVFATLAASFWYVVGRVLGVLG